MNKLQLDTMLMLNAAITLFLFFTGMTTCAVARTRALSLPHMRGFTLILAAFWVGRLVLELVMPLQIPLAFIQHPSLFAKLVMGLPVAALSIPVLIDLRHCVDRRALARSKQRGTGHDVQ